MLTFNPEDKTIKNTYKLLGNIRNLGVLVAQISVDKGYFHLGVDMSFIKGFFYPTNTPKGFELTTINKFELVNVIEYHYNDKVFKELGLVNPFELNDRYSVRNYVLIKDVNDVQYLIALGNFKIFTKIDFKENRNEKAGIGRLINKLLQATNYKFEPKDLESFVNRYKAYKKILDGEATMEVVSGDEIRKWYDESRYSNGLGSLNKSCMRFEDCQDYFTIYTQNPEVCQMVILYNSDKTKIEGRALLWTLIDGRKVMDRIYTTSDSFINIFTKWATDNGYEPRENLLHIRGGIIQLKKLDYSPYPYLDTFMYYNMKRNTLSTSSGSNCVILNDTEGDYMRCEYCDGTGEITCEDCDGGKIACSECDGSKYINEEGNDITCPECNGTGYEKCDSCNGNGSYGCPECS
jgi:hypothetical protein